MKVVTRESRAAEAYTLWCYQYGPNTEKQRTDWQVHLGPNGRYVSGEIVANKLKELGANPDPDKVDEITGNTSWTNVPVCDECETDSAPAVTLFFTRHGNKVVAVCGMCLLKGLNIMEEVHL